MTQLKSSVRSFFAQLGLPTEIADLYLALQQHGPQTISELSRSARVERTRIYRILKDLQSLGLIEIETKYKRNIITPAPLANLELLLGQKQTALQQLQTELPNLKKSLSSNPTASPTTKVKYYQGPEGLRQMLWNELKADTEIMAYSYQIFDAGVGRPFMKRWVAEFEQRGLHKKIMFNDAYIKSWHDRPGHRIKGFEYHYIDPSILTIGHTCNVYDNVSCYFSWKDDKIFGVEIHNQDIADAQRQLLSQIWSLSTAEGRF